MTKSITPTTVACSYYLSAQAESAAFNTNLDNSASYQLSFGRSPECTSYAKARDDPSGAWGKLIYSNCGNNASGTLLPPVNYTPIGLAGLGVQQLGHPYIAMQSHFWTQSHAVGSVNFSSMQFA